MVQIVTIIALLFNFIGLLVLVRQGLPHRLLANTLASERYPCGLPVNGGDRQRMWSFSGMVLFALGTGLQMATVALRAS